MTTASLSAITISAQPASLGDCGLCLRPASGLNAAVSVSHGAGTVARFDACEYCERAIRRLVATAPGLSHAGPGVVVRTVAPPEVVEVVEEEVGPAIPIQEYQQPLQDGDGALFSPVVVGTQRSDGTWAGWIEFREIGGARVLRTNRETTQPNQGAVAYWASGLQPSYLEGAFQRARRPHTVRLI